MRISTILWYCNGTKLHFILSRLNIFYKHLAFPVLQLFSSSLLIDALRSISVFRLKVLLTTWFFDTVSTILLRLYNFSVKMSAWIVNNKQTFSKPLRCGQPKGSSLSYWHFKVSFVPGWNWMVRLLPTTKLSAHDSSTMFSTGALHLLYILLTRPFVPRNSVCFRPFIVWIFIFLALAHTPLVFFAIFSTILAFLWILPAFNL